MFFAFFCNKVWVARTCSTSDVPIPNAREPNAPWAVKNENKNINYVRYDVSLTRRMRITTYTRDARELIKDQHDLKARSSTSHTVKPCSGPMICTIPEK